MKNLIITALFALFITGAYAQDGYFGKKITDKGAVASTTLAQKMGSKEKMSAKVTGTVESVCQAKGCWMKIKTTDGQTMRVSFKDYGFFVPKDIAGKTVVFEGEAKVKTTPVAELQHYAEDAGKSKEEIEKITEPKHELTFVADGVIVKK
ncbi:DUF4920 domain-containing protein [Runella sp.]|uniref:DUF4920 domain-containing protein n=1 Tax=Runella sp. TaxID=1960881 RepID=UPI003D0EE67B